MAIRVQQRTVVLNDFGLAERIRTTSRGTSSRYTVTIIAKPMELIFDPKAMGKGPAESITEVLREKVRGIAETAAPATLAARERAKQAFQRGEPWAKRRYGGLYIPPAAETVGLTQGKRSNRLPPMMPGQTSRFWNDSGRFAAGLIARPTKNNDWTINVPANRFDPVTFRGGREALLAAIARLQELVPELGNPKALLKDERVQRAIGEATSVILGDLLGDAFKKNRDLRRALREGRLGAARSLLSGSRAIMTVLGL